MIDWGKGVVFEDGKPAVLHATLSSSGKCAFAGGGSLHAETFATWYEQGARWLVRKSPNSSKIFAYNSGGHPVFVDTGEVNMPIAHGRKRILPSDVWHRATDAYQADVEAMQTAPMWGMF